MQWNGSWIIKVVMGGTNKPHIAFQGNREIFIGVRHPVRHVHHRFLAKKVVSPKLVAVFTLQHAGAISKKRVVLVDSDCNRSATAYGARELLPFPVVPIEAAAKATRLAEIIITDGQASSNEDEIKNLVEGADFILLPTTTQSRSIELTS